MTEIKYRNKIKPTSKNEGFQQIELLFEVYKLRNNREKLRLKLKTLEKMIKREINKSLTNKIEAFKLVSAENNVKIKDIISELNISYNIFKMLEDLENNHHYLANLEEARKKRRVNAQEYEMAKGFYLQKSIDIYNSINQLKNIAILYFQELKDNLILLEDQHIKLTTEKLREKVSKEEFNQKSHEIESLKHQLEEKLAFLEVEIIDLELD